MVVNNVSVEITGDLIRISDDSGEVVENLRLDDLTRKQILISARQLAEGRFASQDELSVVGEQLYRVLFPGDAESFLKRAVSSSTKSDDDWVLLTLMLSEDKEDLVSWPWESLYEPESGMIGGFLAMQRRMALRRSLFGSMRRLEPVEPPLQILVATVRLPDDQIQLEEETVQSFELLSGSPNFSIQLIPHASIVQIRDALRSQSPHIFHYVGSEDSRQGAVSMGSSNGETSWISGQRLIDLLRDASRDSQAPLLAFFHTHTMRAADDPYAGSYLSRLAPNLIRSGLGAAVLQPLDGLTTRRFVRSVYSSIEEGLPFDLAVSRARSEIRIYSESILPVFQTILYSSIAATQMRPMLPYILPTVSPKAARTATSATIVGQPGEATPESEATIPPKDTESVAPISASTPSETEPGVSTDALKPEDAPKMEPTVEYESEPVTSDYWTVTDRLGYELYARAIGEFIQHDETKPPLTIGIKGPWGAGKTSLMRMVQDFLDPPLTKAPTLPSLDQQRRQIPLDSASKLRIRALPLLRRLLRTAPRPSENLGLVTNGTILRKLKEYDLRERSSVQANGSPSLDRATVQSAGQTRKGHRTGQNRATNGRGEEEVISKPRPPSGELDITALPPQDVSPLETKDKWRPTVWFNPWMYQSGEQVWAGLAHEVISQITSRMSRGDKEHFWLALNLARVDRDAVRRKIYRALFERLLPIIGWLILWVMVGLASLVVKSLVPTVNSLLDVASKGAFALGLGGAVIGGVIRTLMFSTQKASGSVAPLLHEPDYLRDWSNFLGDRTRGAYSEIVQDIDYEKRAGFLYFVQADMGRVLNLLGTPKRPVVVFLDDLDRCSPRTVAQVIEAINLFLAGQFPNCIFIIAMEPEMVAAHIEVAYRPLMSVLQKQDYLGESSTLGWRFLDKIVQLPLSLPSLGNTQFDQYLTSVLGGDEEEVADQQTIFEGSQFLGEDETVDRSKVEEIERQVEREQPGIDEIVSVAARVDAEASEHVSSPDRLSPEAQAASREVLKRRLRMDNPEVKAIISDVSPMLAKNPREIKRFVNVFRFYTLVRQERELSPIPSPTMGLEEVARLSLLAVRWPQFINVLGHSIGGESRITILQALESAIAKVATEAKWEDEAKEIEKKLGELGVPEMLSRSLIETKDLCQFLRSGPPIGNSAGGIL